MSCPICGNLMVGRRWCMLLPVRFTYAEFIPSTAMRVVLEPPPPTIEVCMRCHERGDDYYEYLARTVAMEYGERYGGTTVTPDTGEKLLADARTVVRAMVKPNSDNPTTSRLADVIYAAYRHGVSVETALQVAGSWR